MFVLILSFRLQLPLNPKMEERIVNIPGSGVLSILTCFSSPTLNPNSLPQKFVPFPPSPCITFRLFEQAESVKLHLSAKGNHLLPFRVLVVHSWLYEVSLQEIVCHVAVAPEAPMRLNEISLKP